MYWGSFLCLALCWGLGCKDDAEIEQSGLLCTSTPTVKLGDFLIQQLRLIKGHFVALLGVNESARWALSAVPGTM